MSESLLERVCDVARQVGRESGRAASRREFLVGSSAAALTALGAGASAQQNTGNTRRGGFINRGTVSGSSGVGSARISPPTASGTTNKDPFAQYWKDSSIRLARRISFGIKSEDIAPIKSLGFQGYLNQQLNWQAINDSAVSNHLNQQFPTWQMTTSELNSSGLDWTHFIQPYVYYSAYTNRQLHARMVEFWLDHFNINHAKVESICANEYVYKRIFPNAIGNFRTLLGVVAKSPAMSRYLDGQFNIVNKPNINYARELLELHTVGVNGGYSENDINQAAKILTGWLYNWDQSSVNYGQVEFHSWAHEPGAKTVLGHTFNQNGANETEALLDFLCSLPQTHRFIGNKLYRFFIGRDATSAELDFFSAVWEQSDGSIEAMLRNVLTEENVVRSPSMFKRPFHHYVGIYRQFKMSNQRTDMLISKWLWRSDHCPFEWIDPDGFPLEPQHWFSSHLRRLQYTMLIASQHYPDVQYDLNSLFPDQTSDAAVIDQLDQVLFGGELPVPEKLWIYRHLRGKTINVRNIRGAIAVALASPSYQWY